MLGNSFCKALQGIARHCKPCNVLQGSTGHSKEIRQNLKGILRGLLRNSLQYYGDLFARHCGARKALQGITVHCNEILQNSMKS